MNSRKIVSVGKNAIAGHNLSLGLQYLGANKSSKNMSVLFPTIKILVFQEFLSSKLFDVFYYFRISDKPVDTFRSLKSAFMKQNEQYYEK